MKKRVIYLVLALISGILGFVLKMFTASMPFFVANYMPAILWSCSIYLLVSFIVCKAPIIHGGIALVLAISLEALQLFTPSWLTLVRNTAAGAYVLGTDFMIADIFCYIGGIAVCFIVDFMLSARKPKVRKSKYRKEN